VPLRTTTISVLLLLRNAEPYLEDLLGGLSAQSHPFDLRLVAVDSGSTDGTLEILARHTVRVIQIPPREFNHGETRNLAAREAGREADFLVYLSQDALPADDDWLRNLIQPMLDDPSVAGTFSRHIPRQGASSSLVRQLTTTWQTGGTERLVKEMPPDPAEYERDKFFYVYFSNTSSAIRRKVWEQIPFHRLDFAEDADWADRVLRAGYRLVFEPSSIVLHSHDYRIIEQFRQNVDHTEAMVALFDPPHFHRPRRLLLQLMSIPREVIRDWRFMQTSPYYEGASTRRRVGWLIRSPLWHAASVLGGWTGAYLDRLPEAWRKYLGRQRRIQRGYEDR
jgi:rhamnosyltransferase